MKKLTAVFEKTSKIHYIVWFAVMVLASMLKNLYPSEVSFIETFDSLRDSLNDLGMVADAINPTTGLFVSSLAFTGILNVAIFELIIYFFYRSFFMRNQVSNNALFAKTTVRGMYILSNVIVGLFSLLYYPVPVLYYYDSLFTFPVYTSAYIIAYLVLVDGGVINPISVGNVFMKLYTIYFAIEGIFSVFGFFSNLIDGNTHEIVSSALYLAMIIAAAVGIYFKLCKKLLKKEKEAAIVKIIPPDKNDDVPPEIFKGFGF